MKIKLTQLPAHLREHARWIDENVGESDGHIDAREVDAFESGWAHRDPSYRSDIIEPLRAIMAAGVPIAALTPGLAEHAGWADQNLGDKDGRLSFSEVAAYERGWGQEDWRRDEVFSPLRLQILRHASGAPLAASTAPGPPAAASPAARLPLVAVFDDGLNVGLAAFEDAVWENPPERGGAREDRDGNGVADDVYGAHMNPYAREIRGLWGGHEYSNRDDHGTRVASVIAGNAADARGVAAGATKLIAVGGNGSGDALGAFEMSVEYTVGLKRAGHNVRVVNASIGTGVHRDEERQRWMAAIEKLRDEDILLVCAAGNWAKENRPYPELPADFPSSAPFDNVIAVAALDESEGRLAETSNFGATTVHLAAPGVALTTNNRGKLQVSSGTSFAAPHVSAAAALFLREHPQATAAEVKAALLRSAVRLPALQGKTMAGRLDVERLLQEPLSPD